jgi:hypothetical protein
MALRRWGNSPLEGDTTLLGPLVILTTSLPSANQYATSYSQTLVGHGGGQPYVWTLISQSSINTATWQLSSSGVLTNLMPTLLNVETSQLVIQLADSFGTTPVQVTLSIAVVRQIPAGAAALGYNFLLWSSQPTTTNVYTGAYATVPNQPWSSGWPFTNVIPPETLYSETPNGFFAMEQFPGTVNAQPESYMPIISAVQLSETTVNIPVAATLPLIPAGPGFYLSAKLISSGPDPNIRPTIFAFPTQHNPNGEQDIDPNDGNNHRWMEIDIWEGSGGNGKQTVGSWNGALPWSGQSGTQLASNPNFGPADITKEHEYGGAYVPATGTLNIWLDNVANGSCTVQAAVGTPLTAEQLAWINAMTYYPMVAAFNDGTTAYTLGVFAVEVWIPFADTTQDPIPSATVGVPYSFQMTTNNASPYTPYVWTDPDDVLAGYGLTLTPSGLVSGTPTASGTLITFNPICTDAQGNVAQ